MRTAETLIGASVVGQDVVDHQRAAVGDAEGLCQLAVLARDAGAQQQRAAADGRGSRVSVRVCERQGPVGQGQRQRAARGIAVVGEDAAERSRVVVVADAENRQAGSQVVHDRGLGSDARLRQAVDRHVIAVEVQHCRLDAAAEHEVSVSEAVRKRVRGAGLQHARGYRRVARIDVRRTAEDQHPRTAQSQSIVAGDLAAHGQRAAADVDRRRTTERHAAAAQVQGGSAFEGEARVPDLGDVQRQWHGATGVVERAALDGQRAGASAEALPRLSKPLLSVVPPVYPFAVLIVRVPGSLLMSEALPLIWPPSALENV